MYVILLHYPMVNRRGQPVTTAVTNLDIHDIARSCRTYGITGYYLVNPLKEQHDIVTRVLNHWKSDRALEVHPKRAEALSRTQIKATFEEVFEEIRETHGEDPEVVMPDAKPLPTAVSYTSYREVLADPKRTRPSVIVLGTGWGVSDTFYPAVDRFLAPIYGPESAGGYNHLSVRAAAAIILDRLFGC
ncbi:MAG: hypothetical protein CL678_02755 [Bdellovibrionaceae bacterium]|nr:hypothetical protein [Pseudobdellovibrionaceae bacterium]